MCFMEYIGYTCGHTSLPILRPCPLTTASHTFPACTRRADKPFLAGEMCAACQRIIHSRATQIEEYEHRFMHERGVCGCDTVFPYLIRPRFIGIGHSAGADADGTTTTLPPLLDDTDVGGCAVVSVRLASLFAAEWVADHRARHEAGMCGCCVDFRTYHEAVRELEEAEGTFAEGGEDGEAEDDDQQTDASPPVGNKGSAENDNGRAMDGDCRECATHRLFVRADVRRTVSSSPPRWRRQHNSADESDVRVAGRRESSADRHTSGRNCICSCNRGGSGTGSLSGGPPDGQETAAVQLPTAPWLAQRTRNINMDGCSGDGVGVRFAGAVFADVPAYLPITGPFLQPNPYNGPWPLMDGLCPESLEPMEPEADGDADAGTDDALSPVLILDRTTVVDAARASTAANDSSSRALPGSPACTRVPLVGFPIGAGPEGVSHAVPWESRPPCWWWF